jgi:hypothetical protein
MMLGFCRNSIFFSKERSYVNLNFMIFDVSHNAVLEALYLCRCEGVSFGYYGHDVHFSVHAPHELEVNLAKPAIVQTNQWVSGEYQRFGGTSADLYQTT